VAARESLLQQAFWFLLWLIACTGLTGAVMAQGIESIVSPGKLVQSHAKVDDDCKQCHTKFDRKAQDGLCQQCHKEVGTDVRGKTGFHGKMKPQVCRTCHTDHKGRPLPSPTLTRTSLTTPPPTSPCAPNTRKSNAPNATLSTRSSASTAAVQCLPPQDDVQRLTATCSDCHNENLWKEAKFDHDKTRFALTGKHIDTKCADCHKNNNYKETPQACYACHRKDDDQKGHKGQYGDKCDSCHGTKLWKPSSFNHDTDTRYALRGKHRSTTCADCHTGHLYKLKLNQDCNSCHKKDDKHKESLSRNRQLPHRTGWKSPQFEHEATRFPLLGKHAKTDCKECHKSAMFREAPKECFGCHKKDDKHAGNLGDQCAECHAERDWKSTTGRFSHDRTKFKLRNAHADSKIKCNACHKDVRSFRHTALDCISCHKKDDKHENQLGSRCEQCHGDKSWKTTQFDHALSRFALTGRHISTPCKAVTKQAVTKTRLAIVSLVIKQRQAQREVWNAPKPATTHEPGPFGTLTIPVAPATGWAHTARSRESCHRAPAPKGKNAAPVGASCVACHSGEDVHDGQFGNRCEQCHSSDTEKIRSRAHG
jgi:hypothetical protein